MAGNRTALFYEGWRYFWHKDSADTLVYIHIGKCGGLSLWNAIKSSRRIQESFTCVHRIHVRKPPILKNAHYLIVVRDPISRAQSAFNWRRRILITDRSQRDKFDGEYEALQRYPTFNELAEEIVSNGKVVDQVAKAYRSIHHLREDISFYLDDLLEHVKGEQIFSVLKNESLNNDMRDILGIHENIHLNKNQESAGQEREILTSKAKDNLRSFLASEYKALATLEALLKSTSRK